MLAQRSDFAPLGKAREGGRLDLAHALARDPEGLPDFLE
jgi:hypothetical protein